MGSRPYTGFDRNASGKRAGTERFIQLVQELSGGGLWNNGSFVRRFMRGKSRPSVHGTGRAMDLSWRGGKYGGFGSYDKAKEWIDFFVAHAADLEIELLIDYYPKPHGAGYKCDRDRFVKYTSSTVKGAPGGDWIHIELSPKVADDPGFFERVLPALRKGVAVDSPKPVDEPVLEAPGPENYPGHAVDVGHGHEHEVKAVQERIGVKVDGDFGPNTKRGVEAFQRERNLAVTGIVDEATWRALFGVAPSDDTTTVEAGDSWWKLAERALGNGSRWRELAGLNGGEERVLLAGDVIMLPTSSAPAGGTVEVEPGDSWWKLSERAFGNGARWAEIAALNGGEERVLHAGDTLDLP
jgi:nucleoid-associated protein YgaU